MIVAFTGGTGGTKLLQGLQAVVQPEELTVIVNTGDDLECWGLHVSPDVDSVLYGLSSLLSKDRGWGIENDSFRCLERMKELGQPAWFSLGDLDLATHLARSSMLRAGMTLTEVTRELAKRMGVRACVLPMSDQRVATVLETSKGTLSFQEYFVRERHRLEVTAVEFAGAQNAKPSPGVLDAIAGAEVIVFAPSNPITSIGPILAVPGIRQALMLADAPVVAVSPFIGGAAVSGPAADLMRIEGSSGTISGLMKLYRDFVSVLIAHDSDREQAEALETKGIQVVHADILMNTFEQKRKLAEVVLQAACDCVRGARA